MTGFIEKNKKWLPWVFLFVLILVFTVQNFVFLERHKAFSISDSPRHILRGYVYVRFLSRQGRPMIPRDPFPPVTYLTEALFYKLFGFSEKTAAMTTFIFAIIFILSMYGTGYKLGGHLSGAAVALLAAASPHFLNYSRRVFIDFPAAAMTALGFYVLLLTDNCRKTKYAYLAGFVFALAFLTKWSAVFFLIIPFLWPLFTEFWKDKRALAISVAGLAYFFFIFMGVKKFVFLQQDHSVGDIFLRIYPLWFFIPSVLVLVVSHFLEKNYFNNSSESDTERIRAALNFVRIGAVVALLVTPWVLWCTKTIYIKFFGDWAEAKNFMSTLRVNVKILLTQFSFGLPLIIAGGVFAFIKEDPGGRRKMTFINLLLVVLIMSYITLPSVRYVLSFVIFTSAVGGSWIQFLGKKRFAAFGVIALISMVSIVGWIFIPPSTPLVKTVKVETEEARIEASDVFGILLPEYPIESQYGVEKIINLIEPYLTPLERGRRPWFISIQEGARIIRPLQAENFAIEFLKRGKWVELQNVEVRRMHEFPVERSDVFILLVGEFNSSDEVKDRIYKRRGMKPLEEKLFIYPGSFQIEVIIYEPPKEGEQAP